MKMVEFERLKETAERLINRLNEGGLRALDEALNATGKTAATYRYTYDRYIQYFREKSLQEELSEQDLYVGFAMAYSWMATIKQLDPRIDTIQNAVSALNRLRRLKPSDVMVEESSDERISPEQAGEIGTMIEPVRQFLSSVIGTSKLLHFVNPDVFPIWDSVIHKFCDSLKQTRASDSLNRYVEYTFNIHLLINHTHFDTLIYTPLTDALERDHRALSDLYRKPERMGKVRATEFIMFFGGKVSRLMEPGYLKRRSRIKSL